MTGSGGKSRPPVVAEWLLNNFTSYDERFFCSGDFRENYLRIVETEGILRAKLWYWTQVLVTLPAYILITLYWSIAMIKNYIKIALRNIKKQKAYSFINISGLAVGMACFIVIMLYINNELGYDTFHEKAGRIYRFAQNSDNDVFSGTPFPLGPLMKKDFPEVVDFVRMRERARGSKVMFKSGDTKFYETGFFLADPSFFDMFTFPLISGDPSEALRTPGGIVITESIAKKYFGSENPIGKSLMYDDRTEYVITGVARDVPENSHFHFNFVSSIEPLAEYYNDQWGASNFKTYILLEKDTSPDKTLEKLAASWEKYGVGNDRFLGSLFLQPVTKIHLKYVRGNSEPVFEMKYIYIFSAVAFIILLIACINYMNLSTARSAKRSKEIGLRKVVGAKRSQLIKQLLGESLVVSLLAFVIALTLAIVFLPVFNQAAGSDLKVDFFDTSLLLSLLFLSVIVGLSSGIYPALFLSSYRPVKVIKGQAGSERKGGKFRNSLVIFQFAISIALIICAIIINQQMRYINEKDLGWNREHLVTIPLYEKSIRESTESLKTEFLKNPNIINASASSFLPTVVNQRHGVWWEGKDENEGMMVWVYIVDHDFFKTYEIDIIEGRDFSKDIKTDTEGAYVLNKAAAQTIGWDKPIGKLFNAGFTKDNKPVIGITDNFNFRSLHHEIEPCLFYIIPGSYKYLTVRIRGEKVKETISFLNQSWHRVTSGADFEYFFMDEEFDRLYKSEIRIVNVIGYFTGLAIFIACLGLFGLSAFMSEQRRKEIGIRKVLGASISNVVLMLSKDFVKWVIIANVLAWPAAYYAMNNWLQDFAYKVDIKIYVMVLSGLLAVLIALLTVSWQAFKAARANPVNTIRYE